MTRQELVTHESQGRAFAVTSEAKGVEAPVISLLQSENNKYKACM